MRRRRREAIARLRIVLVVSPGGQYLDDIARLIEIQADRPIGRERAASFINPGSRGRLTFAAINGQHVLGLISLARSSLNGDAAFVIDRLVVEPSLRGNGLGKRLVQTALAHEAVRRTKYVVCIIAPTDQIAGKLLTKLKFDSHDGLRYEFPVTA